MFIEIENNDSWISLFNEQLKPRKDEFIKFKKQVFHSLPDDVAECELDCIKDEFLLELFLQSVDITDVIRRATVFHQRHGSFLERVEEIKTNWEKGQERIDLF